MKLRRLTRNKHFFIILTDILLRQKRMRKKHENNFKELGEAYKVLSNPMNKSRYDKVYEDKEAHFNLIDEEAEFNPQIFRAFFESGPMQECQKMWCSLRDGYMREKRSQMLTKSGSAAVKEKKPWKWYNHMIFLSDHISFRPTQSNFELPIRVEVGSGGEIQETEEPEENVIYEDSGQVQLDYVAETNPILFESPNGRTSSCSFAQPRSPTPKRKKARRESVQSQNSREI
ncbi:hypothetical protein QYM36_000658 [Artemia franciscana]|uniref:MADF domain-containing protein n=1 Tax=Artemia franciscana TaxID=6661 RepID=A0AA88IT05_ARTSF|nr:hypothetical protein QYM36_000658 [Artemia franciscana]